jgi:histidinol-phosphate aminotransferase
VLLMRTLSKFGLAGVRIGYMMGPAALIAEVDKVRPPYNISVLNCRGALFALEHQEVFAAQAADLRGPARADGPRWPAWPAKGVKAWPSDANMILVRVPDARPRLRRHEIARGCWSRTFLKCIHCWPIACA